jgi:hypothetical protein
MTDRELLELAAKAAKIDVLFREDIGYFCTVTKRIHEKIFCGIDTEWNPLEDDGDALQLAVKLSINIQHETLARLPFEETVNCGLYGENSPEWCEEIKGNDPYTATRRAIVRAAAEIGKDMK